MKNNEIDKKGLFYYDILLGDWVYMNNNDIDKRLKKLNSALGKMKGNKKNEIKEFKNGTKYQHEMD